MYNIVKHRYIKGRKGVEKAQAHIRYIQYREGEDRDKNAPARPFFDEDRDELLGLEVRRQIADFEGPGVVMHKLILSPAINGVDLKEYTREVMEELSEQKGQRLDWKALIHQNTDHHHVHVCVMGKDLDGMDVRFNRNDYKEIIKSGDRYLDREHYYDRFLDRELHDLTTRESYQRRGDRLFKEIFYDEERFKKLEEQRQKDKERYIPKENWDRDEAVKALPPNEKIYANDNVYSKFSTREELLELNQYAKEAELWLKPELYDKMWSWIGVKNRAGDDFYEKEARGVKDHQTYEDFKRFEEDLRISLRGDNGEIKRSVRGEQRILEQQGRFSDYHYKYTNAMRQQRLEEIAEHDPEKSDWAKREIEQMKQFDNEHWKDHNAEIDKLLYGCEKAWTPSRDKKDRSDGAGNETQITTSDDKKSNDDSRNDPEVRMDLLGGRRQIFDEDERDQDIDRDFHGNER